MKVIFSMFFFVIAIVSSYDPRTTLSQDVQTRSSVQLAFVKFLSKINGNF